MVTPSTTLDRLLDTGVMAVMRARSSGQLLAAAQAVLAGGIQAIEVAMTTPGALHVIQESTAQFGQKVVFGAGSVLDPETASACVLAGAQFIVCPTVNIRTIQFCNRYSIPVLPGAYTPTEILTAWEAGASVVKIFPASLGGPGYIKAVKAPLPQVRMAAVGGVTVENTADFFRAGVVMVGVGGELVNQQLLDNHDFDEITARAQKFRSQVLLVRQERGS